VELNAKNCICLPLTAKTAYKNFKTELNRVSSNLDNAFCAVNGDKFNLANCATLFLMLADKNWNYILQKWWMRRDIFQL
jgi:hypothetical protein